MTTPRVRSRVSLAAAFALTLVLGGCARNAARDVTLPRREESPLAVQFDNWSRDVVHVHLVGDRREWRLGRVEPGGRAQLRIPDAALLLDGQALRLVVVSGEHVALRAADAARATATVTQPATMLLAQQWTFSTGASLGQLVALPRAAPSRP